MQNQGSNTLLLRERGALQSTHSAVRNVCINFLVLMTWLCPESESWQARNSSCEGRTAVYRVHVTCVWCMSHTTICSCVALCTSMTAYARPLLLLSDIGSPNWIRTRLLALGDNVQLAETSWSFCSWTMSWARHTPSPMAWASSGKSLTAQA